MFETKKQIEQIPLSESQLETKRDEAWRAYEVAAREIERRNDALMDEVEKKMAQHITERLLFTIRWRLK